MSLSLLKGIFACFISHLEKNHKKGLNLLGGKKINLGSLWAHVHSILSKKWSLYVYRFWEKGKQPECSYITGGDVKGHRPFGNSSVAPQKLNIDTAQKSHS